MLTREDLKWNLRSFDVVASLGFFPVGFDGVSGRMETRGRIWRTLGFRCWQLLLIFYNIWLTTRTIESISGLDWDFLPINVIMTVGFVFVWFWGVFIFDSDPSLTAKLYNELLREIHEAGDAEGERKKSLLELMLCYFLYPSYALPLLYPVLYFVDMNIPMLLISGVEADGRNVLTIPLCCVVEMIFLWITVNWGLLAFFIILSFIITFIESVDTNIREITSGDGNLLSKLDDAFLTLRTLELKVGLFNRVFAKILALVKYICMVVTVLGGFSGIRLIHRNPALGCLYTSTAIECAFCFLAIFDLAFKITEKGEELKHSAMILSERSALSGPRRSIRMAMEATPPFSLSIGGFYRVERETIPVFLDFVVKQIVGLLVGF